MSCHEYKEDLMDVARVASIDEAGREALLEHLEVCSYCKLRLSNQRALTGGLLALAESNRSQQASERLEGSLLDSYRQRNKVRSRRAIAWISTAAAAAAIVIFFALRSPMAPDSHLTRATATIVKEKPVISTLQAAVDKHSITGPALSTPGNRSPLARKVKHQNPGPELAYFLPLDNYEPIEMGVVVRVQLPGSFFGSPGTPLDEDQSGEPIEADILVGEDGSARAIRFVLE